MRWNRKIILINNFVAKKSAYFYATGDSRKDVMKWIVDFDKNLLRKNNITKNDIPKWYTCKNLKRGIIKEYFEIARLLEIDAPNESLNILDLNGKQNIKFKINSIKKKIKNLI